MSILEWVYKGRSFSGFVLDSSGSLIVYFSEVGKVSNISILSVMPEIQ